jgi:hypothetical protein
MALRSAGFAPHAGAAGSPVRTVNGNGGFTAHTAQVPAGGPTRVEGSNGGYTAHTAQLRSYSGNRGAAPSYHVSAYRAPQARPSAPASHASAPHGSAPRGAPHGEHH